MFEKEMQEAQRLLEKQGESGSLTVISSGRLRRAMD